MIKRALFISAFILLLILCAREIYLYSRSSSHDAEMRAKKVFEEECPRLVTDCRDFIGPKFDGKWQGMYKFRWEKKSGRGIFFVEISYLPFRSDRWYVPDGE